MASTSAPESSRSEQIQKMKDDLLQAARDGDADRLCQLLAYVEEAGGQATPDNDASDRCCSCFVRQDFTIFPIFPSIRSDVAILICWY